MSIETLSETSCFGGRIGFYRHASGVNDCDMRFSVFVPPQAAAGKVPVLTFLSGLTCTEENFMVKSGAQRVAAELGMMLVSPDTSPRGDGVPDDPDGDYDFGLGAGFYLNATEAPWSRHYQMYDYITREFQDIVFDNFPGDRDRHGLTGHSMGGHGALVIGLRNVSMFRSLSAFAPICTTLHSPWGKKALGYYLGNDTTAWHDYDACEVARYCKETGHYRRILVDQGADDPYLEEQLKPERLEAACRESGLPLDMRIHDGYDHGYYLGNDATAWRDYDACEVARYCKETGHYRRILVDQGADDPYLEEQLKPKLLEAACRESGLPLDMRIHDGYDHGYYFISTFIEDHLRFHATELGR